MGICHSIHSLGWFTLWIGKSGLIQLPSIPNQGVNTALGKGTHLPLITEFTLIQHYRYLGWTTILHSIDMEMAAGATAQQHHLELAPYLVAQAASYSTTPTQVVTMPWVQLRALSKSLVVSLPWLKIAAPDGYRFPRIAAEQKRRGLFVTIRLKAAKIVIFNTYFSSVAAVQ
ncbi:hypothetical protein H6P81_003313 [Aristolochia fimbriata]|uniref:Uncharacterized protein n=1 Tax=Aristolochia fimbriata TaxID=158543 RepID=A0AAV7FC80_ARIFI|nr:hypothetical protein H6P81_003313 [Aristolochia fimbriata]